MTPKQARDKLCIESECTFDEGCGCIETLNVLYDEILDAVAKVPARDGEPLEVRRNCYKAIVALREKA